MTQEELDEHIERLKEFVHSLPLEKDRKYWNHKWKDEAGRVYAVDGMYLIDGPEYEKKGK